jgi:pimeloyl-ACP methyl ester carboxylesterase
MVAVVARFKEQAVLLGERRSLVGIITRPLISQRSDAPAIVILNTGIVHRVGHHRMYVTLSRLLAEAGRMVVRFDFSGIGDSEPRNDHLSPVIACLAEIKEVLDSIENTHQVSRFVLVGLCSGADHAALYAHTDPRVVAVVLMDPTLPPTARYYLHYLIQRLRNLRSWVSVITGRSGLLRLMSAHLRNRMRPQGGLEDLNLQNLQFSKHLAKCYHAAAVRGIKMLSVFTSVSARHTYQQQMRDAFPEAASRGALRLEFFPDSDHLFSAHRERMRLYRVILDWLGSS